MGAVATGGRSGPGTEAKLPGRGRIVSSQQVDKATMSPPRIRITADLRALPGGRLSDLPSLRIVKLGLTLSALIILLAPPPARATLGEPAQSIAADQQALGGQVQTFSPPSTSAGEQALHEQPPVPSSPLYTVEQISTPAGVTVNEYVSPNGTVFAVSWRGPRPPDLAQLLGAYFAEYQAAAAAPQAQRRHLVVQSAHLVVEASGHMRDLRGRAYVPSLMPPGVSTDEIQ